MGGADLSTTIGRPTGSAGFDGNGMAIYRNKNTVSLTSISFINIYSIFLDAHPKFSLSRTYHI